MNKWLALGMLGFVGGFGAYTASRLSEGALAVIAGVSIGLIASTVIGILLIYAMRGRPKQADPPPQQQGYGYPGMPYAGHMMPPIVVMPGYPQQALAAPPQQVRPDVRMDGAVSVPFVVEDTEDGF